MSIDYGQKEREFLDSLGIDTGRDLAAWMSAIAAANLSERNEIIDWLRHQGFMFSKASWLERIFNNGGKPIYGERGRDKTRERSSRSPARPVEAAPVPPAPAPAPALGAEKPLAAPRPRPAPVPDAEIVPVPVLMAAGAPLSAPVEMQTNLETTLAKAKAFRPLAVYLLSEIRKAVPEAVPEPHTHHVAILVEGTEVAVVAVSAKDIRLYIAALGMPFDGGFSPAKSPQGLVGIRLSPTHMVALTDARAVTPELIARVRAASLSAAGKS